MDIRQKEPVKGSVPEVAVVMGDEVGQQWLGYKGKVYHVDDIISVMKAAESGDLHDGLPNYIVAEVLGDHYVLALRQNGIYRPKGNFGDMVRDARQTAELFNKHVPKDV